MHLATRNVCRGYTCYIQARQGENASKAAQRVHDEFRCESELHAGFPGLHRRHRLRILLLAMRRRIEI